MNTTKERHEFLAEVVQYSTLWRWVIAAEVTVCYTVSMSLVTLFVMSITSNPPSLGFLILFFCVGPVGIAYLALVGQVRSLFMYRYFIPCKKDVNAYKAVVRKRIADNASHIKKLLSSDGELKHADIAVVLTDNETLEKAITIADTMVAA
jgi:hypothetical protein